MRFRSNAVDVVGNLLEVQSSPVGIATGPSQERTRNNLFLKMTTRMQGCETCHTNSASGFGKY